MKKTFRQVFIITIQDTDIEFTVQNQHLNFNGFNYSNGKTLNFAISLFLNDPSIF